MENKKYYMNAEEVASYIGVSVPTAYKVMQKLNSELKSKGYITISGRVPKTYFLERTYGGENVRS